MAAFETSRPVSGMSAGRVSGFLGSIVASFVAWNEIRVTRNALSKLNDRELADIGLVRGDIDSIGERLR